MVSCLIGGKSQFGKTSLAQELANKYHENECIIAVFDPLHVEGKESKAKAAWKADFITNIWDKFIEWAWTHTNAKLFIEEAQDRFPNTTTFGKIIRHLGHSVHYSVHFPTDVPPAIRNECDHLITSRMPTDCGKVLRQIFVCEGLKDIVKIDRYHFTWVNPLHNEIIENFNSRDEEVITKIADFVMDEAEAGESEEMVETIGIYNNEINWDYLIAEGHIDEDAQRYGTEKL